jgi:hypothetical protein
MASGSFNIDTYSWYRSLPLSNDTVPYPFLTMFAVGPSSFLAPYTFAQYQSATGFCNTTQMSNIITSNLNYGLTSTAQLIKDVYQSTFPTQNFISTYSSFTIPYGPNSIWLSPKVPLGKAMESLIQSRKYNVFAEFQYNVWVSTPYDTFTWISTTGFIGRDNNTIGRSIVTRIGNTQYQTIRQELMFAAQTYNEQNADSNGQIGQTPSTFQFMLQFQSSPSATNQFAPAFEVFIPGENNYTLTLIPTTSTII